MGRLEGSSTRLLVRPFAVAFIVCLCIWVGLGVDRDALMAGSLQSGAGGPLGDWIWMSSEQGTTTVETVGTVLGGCARALSRMHKRGDCAGLVRRSWSGFRATVPYSEALLAVAGTLTVVYVLRCGTRRYKTAMQLPPLLPQKGHWLQGLIVTVNDSDNVRFYHYAPWQRILFWRRPDVGRGAGLKEETINVRLAGIDAPEMGHFGGTPQPFSREAKEWLTEFTRGRRATIHVHRLDQYARAVASVYVWRWGGLWRRNVSLAMVRAGYATVYASAGAEYGGIEAELRGAEVWAQRRGRGMWVQSELDYVSPAAYKRQQLLARASARNA